MKAHWEKVYSNNPDNTLGWYEDLPEPSIKLIDSCKLDSDDIILNVGAGTTTLIDLLLKKGYSNIIVNDISSVAIEKLKSRTGDDSKNKVKWIVDDLLDPQSITNIGQVDLWHDRAVLHFFTEDDQQESYFRLLRQLVKPGGSVIIATFNLQGALKCSGLPVFRYDKHMLQQKLGLDFSLLQAFDYTYTNPSGNTREYVYTLFKRLS
jgi:SAM-dependent methyltransferase